METTMSKKIRKQIVEDREKKGKIFDPFEAAVTKTMKVEGIESLRVG